MISLSAKRFKTSFKKDTFSEILLIETKGCSKKVVSECVESSVKITVSTARSVTTFADLAS